MSTHPSIGHNIVSASELDEEAGWVLHHHERWDGSGYPDGLSGDEIPLESRIILVADAFEAIISDRPYRSRRSPEQALEEIVRNAGTQFDPGCVAALCAVFGHDSAVDELAALRRARDEALEELSGAG
jgi:HD-GYP domain-containing protein (c-di-GMP phosphodiesterase class II)